MVAFLPKWFGQFQFAGSGGVRSAIRLNAVARAVEFAMAGSHSGTAVETGLVQLAEEGRPETVIIRLSAADSGHSAKIKRGHSSVGCHLKEPFPRALCIAPIE
jgi:hypothetical protein